MLHACNSTSAEGTDNVYNSGQEIRSIPEWCYCVQQYVQSTEYTEVMLWRLVELRRFAKCGALACIMLSELGKRKMEAAPRGAGDGERSHSLLWSSVSVSVSVSEA